VTWTQVYDPLGHWWLSTLVAGAAIIVLLGLLAGLKVKAHLLRRRRRRNAVICAIVVFRMPAKPRRQRFFLRLGVRPAEKLSGSLSPPFFSTISPWRPASSKS